MASQPGAHWRGRRLQCSAMNSRRVTGRCLGGVLVALGLSACAERVPVRSGTPPVVVGLKDSGLTPRLRGLVLLDELGCTACHHHEPSDPRRGPDLATAGNRVLAPRADKPACRG